MYFPERDLYKFRLAEENILSILKKVLASTVNHPNAWTRLQYGQFQANLDVTFSS